MNGNTEKFLQLVNDNPELLIIPVVNSDIICDDCVRYWMGSFGTCSIDEYAIYEDESIYFKDNESDLIKRIAFQDGEGTYEDFKRAEDKVKTMWKKAIIVRIDWPDYTDES